MGTTKSKIAKSRENAESFWVVEVGPRRTNGIKNKGHQMIEGEIEGIFF